MLHPAHEQHRFHQGSVLRAALLVGFGLAGLLDSLLLAQVRVASLVAWMAVAIGIALLWHAWQAWGEPRPTPRLVGGLMLGAGAFGVADSLLAHLAWGLHHVPQGGDAAYFAAAVIVALVGMRVCTIPNRALRRARARVT